MEFSFNFMRGFLTQNSTIVHRQMIADVNRIDTTNPPPRENELLENFRLNTLLINNLVAPILIPDEVIIRETIFNLIRSLPENELQNVPDVIRDHLNVEFDLDNIRGRNEDHDDHGDFQDLREPGDVVEDKLDFDVLFETVRRIGDGGVANLLELPKRLLDSQVLLQKTFEGSTSLETIRGWAEKCFPKDKLEKINFKGVFKVLPVVTAVSTTVRIVLDYQNPNKKINKLDLVRLAGGMGDVAITFFTPVGHIKTLAHIAGWVGSSVAFGQLAMITYSYISGGN